MARLSKERRLVARPLGGPADSAFRGPMVGDNVAKMLVEVGPTP